jgi:DNA-binding transcriptional ArsR family regulator
MKQGPNITAIAALIGDPARANMLTALMAGRALSAMEPALEAGVTPQTASSHLAKLEHGGLVVPEKQGRHRYFRLSGTEVAGVLEALMGLAARTGHVRVGPGPRDPALRHARVCYDHLAGELGVRLFEGLLASGVMALRGNELRVTGKGAQVLAGFGIDVAALRATRRPLRRACLDWSERRSHLAGALGAALLQQFFALGWARRDGEGRAVRFSRCGERGMLAMSCRESGGAPDGA